MRVHGVVSAVATIVVLLSCDVASARHGAVWVRPPTGDRDGLALLARIHHAYAGVPAVTVSGRTGTLLFRWTLVLRSGVGIAEEFVGQEPSKTTLLVASRGGSTFAREPGSPCWRALRSSDPQALDNLGLPFPDQPAMKVRAPQATSTGALLPVVVDGTPGTFSVDHSFRLRLITVNASGHRILEHVTILRSVPELARPEPRC
jgi:hypothetical protein